MNMLNAKRLAVLIAVSGLGLPAVSAQVNPDDATVPEMTDQSTSQGEAAQPIDMTSPAEPSIDTIDGTGQRATSDPTTETIDGTGLMNSDPAGTETIDGTGQRAAQQGTETIDGTGGPLSAPQTDLAESGESLLTVPASTRSAGCVETGDAAAAADADCEPASESGD